jgi:hypothetical protein
MATAGVRMEGHSMIVDSTPCGSLAAGKTAADDVKMQQHFSRKTCGDTLHPHATLSMHDVDNAMVTTTPGVFSENGIVMMQSWHSSTPELQQQQQRRRRRHQQQQNKKQQQNVGVR